MRLTIPLVVRWSDLDAYGHVNNAALFRLLEEARIQAFWASDEAQTAPASAILDGSRDAETWTIIARQEAEYLAQIPHHREPIRIVLWIGRLGGASLDICYEVRSPDGDTLFARAATTIVLVDAASQSPRRLSAEERAAWEPYIEEPLTFRRR